MLHKFSGIEAVLTNRLVRRRLVGWEFLACDFCNWTCLTLSLCFSDARKCSALETIGRPVLAVIISFYSNTGYGVDYLCGTSFVCKV